ncbi:hypothetical protein [Mammaliicoccus sp. Dog046]|nr:hypothetical protein [Mammaliicoccus sp. Dog046]WQK86451.1 hypothetical protein P3U32_05410 [Mammaliicoccus sp. Dog046]
MKQAPFSMKEALAWCENVSGKSVQRICAKRFKSDDVRYKKYRL